ncbi:MAG: T9SS type A sorting domain-containing protein, partial [Bacteroidia bacterium]
IGSNAATQYIKRFWSVVPNGLTTNPIYDVEYRYADLDIEGSEAILRPVKYSTETATPGWISSPGSGANAIDGTASNFDSGLNKFNWDNLTTFSDFSAAGNGAPLPIELLSFDAQAVGNSVVVEWTTASEINNDYFTIERSVDAVNYTAIGIVDGAGNSNSSRNYQFIDAQPLQGVSYYRLRQTDFNGTTEVFDPAVVNFNVASTQGVSMFPNPAVDYAHIMLQSEASGNGTIRITDLSGRVVFEQNVSMKSGVQPFTLETRSLSMGTYLVSVSMADGRMYTLPLVKN